MGVFGVLPAHKHASLVVTKTFTPKGSPPLKPVATEGRGYQFPRCQLPPAGGKMGCIISSNNATKTMKTPTTPSRTTAPLFPDEILPNLYISDLETASAILSPNYASPGRPKIKYILSLLECVADQPKVIDTAATSDYVLKLIIVNDWFDTNLIEHLPDARSFIKKGLEANDGGVLVHCRKGVSRSGSVVIAHVMESLNLDYDAAFLHVKKNRAKVYPNIGFQTQLKLWRSLNYSLVDVDGTQKDAYTDWKKVTRLRRAF